MWSSKRLPHDGQNSTHNEVQAFYECARAIVHVRKLLQDIGVFKLAWTTPTICLGDNNQAIKFSLEDYTSPGNRFYARDVRFIKRRVKDGTIDSRYINTKENLVDVGTKSVGPDVIARLSLRLAGQARLLPPCPAPPAT